jgi:ribonuclease VapC
MIVVDASAVLAIVLCEADAAVFETVLAAAPGAVMSPVNYWEVLVRSRGEFDQAGVDHAQALMDRAEIVVVPADAEMARTAADAFARYKGRAGGRLNMGDCFAYALAAREGDGLLYKGNDFTRTDVKSALARGD